MLVLPARVGVQVGGYCLSQTNCAAVAGVKIGGLLCSVISDSRVGGWVGVRGGGGDSRAWACLFVQSIAFIASPKLSQQFSFFGGRMNCQTSRQISKKTRGASSRAYRIMRTYRR